MLGHAYHDVPWNAPDLIAHELADVRSRGSSGIHGQLIGLGRPMPSRVSPSAPAQTPQADPT
jgi:hypothetical protein